ncbi:YjgN family protein [Dyella sp. C9]|uniref:YjgN family protein n=1 Tax=Dyella sp. C9 TaxID=2202154 RepID=UPI000DEF5450|nr:YjgN family protein [Dyella sp. C9]
MHHETMASGIYLPELDVPAADLTDRSRRLEFRGNARDYFRIWIVNVALSLVTLGIYSAWATVRTRRYMYASTALADTPFEYLARPLPILRGRLLTALIFALYALAGHVSRPVQLGAALVVGLFMPWMIVKSLMFRARYSSWRGLRFHFTQDYAGAYQWYLLTYLLLAVPMVLVIVLSAGGHALVGLLLAFAAFTGIYPWIKGNQQQWMIEHHHFGGKSFRFKGQLSNYYAIYIKAVGIAIVAFLACAALFGALAVSALKGHLQGFNPKAPPIWFIASAYLVMAPAYLAVWTYAHKAMTNQMYNQAQLGSYRFHSTLAYWPLLGIYLSNAVVVLCTLGLAWPWARIRLARYRAANLEIIGGGDLNDFVRDAFSHGEVGAAATEMDSLLGIDIGL